jgi:intracellular sulfur oxidation DsrE/DsrF family protein
MNKIVLIIAALLFISTGSHALGQSELSNNSKALEGVTKTKAYFDVTIGDPKALLIRLELIEKTYHQLVAAGVNPDLVVGVRSKASNFFTKGQGYVLDSDLPEKNRIAAMVKKLSGMKIDIEQCRIAAGFEAIDIADFLPEMELVANGYVSMIGYHAQGYAFVPMD